MTRFVEDPDIGRHRESGPILLVTAGVAVTALLATWQPARHAARIDPKVLLKN